MPERVHHDPKATPEVIESGAAREQQGRYSLLLREHRYAEFSAAVKSGDVPPDPELVRAAYQMGRGNFDIVQEIYKATGIKDEWERERVSEFVRFALNRDDILRVQKMMEITGAKIPEHEMSFHYNKWLRSGRIDLLEEAISIFDIRTALSNESVQDGFERLVRSGNASAIIKLKEITGVVPSITPNDFRYGVRQLAHGQNVHTRAVVRFIEVCGKIPDDETMQVAYQTLAWLDLDEFTELIELTGIQPSAETVDSIYLNLFGNNSASDFKKMQAISPCRLSRDELYATYALIISNGFGYKLPPVAEAIGVPAPREVVLEGIRKMAEQSRSTSVAVGATAMETLEAFAIALNPEEARDLYYLILTSGMPRDINPIIEYTGIPVHPETVDAAYFKLSSNVHKFVSIREVTGIPPSADAVERLYANYTRSPGKLIFLRDILGILPRPEWVQKEYRLALQTPDHIRNGIEYFEKLMEATWVKPEEATIALAVQRMIQLSLYDKLAFIKDLYGGTIPELDATQVQQAYQDLLKRHVPNSDRLFSVLKLHELTRIPIAIPKEQAQLALFWSLQNGEIDTAVQFYDACVEKPEWKSAQVEIGYEEVIAVADAPGIKLLRERSGIMPTLEAIRRGYHRLFGQMRNLQNFADVVALVGPPPDADDVQKGYALVYRSLNADGVKIIENATGISPAPETLQQAYQHFIAGSELMKLDELGGQTGVGPTSETVQEGMFAILTKRRGASLAGYRKLFQRFGAPTRDTFLRAYDALLKADDVDWSDILTNFPDDPNAKLTSVQAQLLYAKLIANADIEEIDWYIKETGVPFEATPEARAAIRIELGEISRRLSPKAYVKRYGAIKAFWPPGESLPAHPNAWTEMYMRLTKLQAPALREEYDPWEAELDPLMGTQNVLDVTRDGDPEILYDFVREYGMYNLPTVLRWHAALRRARTIADIPSDVKEEIENALKIVLDRLPNPGAVVVEIKKFRRRIQEELLLDRVPREIVGTAAGRELFDSLKGSTRWGQGDSTHELVSKWIETARARPEDARLGEGHQSVRMEVAQAVSKSAEDVRDEEDRIREIVSNPEVVAALERMDAALWQTMALPQRWENARGGVMQLIDAEIAVLEQSLAGEGANEKKKKGIHGKLLVWRTKREEVLALAVEGPPESGYTRFLEELRLAVPEKMTARDDLLRGVSARLMLYAMNAGWYDRAVVMGRRRPPPWTAEHVQGYADFLVNYINEHYLHPDQWDHNRTAHAPFSKELLRELRGVWGLRGELKTNPLVQAADRIRRIQEGGGGRKGPAVEIELVPARGVLRIFAGDVGDACYTSQHEFLARGGVPGITAYTFVTGRGTTNERLRGSVLVVETKTRDGREALIVRANNPQENLLGQVDSGELIKKTLDEMIELARRRGADVVAVPVSGQGSATTNRGAVADYYQREFGGRSKVGLVQEPATRFNGYDIWDEQSHNGVSVIWERQ